MADESLDLLIRIQSDQSGLKQTTAGIEDFKGKVQDGGKAIGELGGEAKRAHSQIQQATQESTKHHHLMGQAIKGLRHEFPELYHVAHMALHPISLAVFGIVGSFEIWKKRVEECQKLLGDLELPDISEREVGHVNALAEAFEKYSDALHRANEEAKGPFPAFMRELARLKEELGLTKELTTAQAGAAIAGGANKLGIERVQEHRVNTAEEQTASKELIAKIRTRETLEYSATEKENRAAHIKVASAEDDAKTSADLKARAEAARKDSKERDERLKKLLEFQSGEGSAMDAIGVKTRQFATGMSVEEMIAAEESGIAQNRGPIDRYNAFEKSRRGRDRQRAERDRLLEGAKGDRDKARDLGAEIPTGEQSLLDQTRIHRETERLHDLTRTRDAASALNESMKHLQEEILKASGTAKGVAETLIQKFQQESAQFKALERRVKTLESGSVPIQ